MKTEDIYKWMDDPSLLTSATLEDLRGLVGHYPYFQPIRFLFLKNLYLEKDVAFYEELEKASVFVSDHRKLFYYLSVVEGLWNDVFEYYAAIKESKPDPEKLNTLSLIDSFLTDYAPEMLTERPQRPTHQAARIAIATQDYASLLVDKENVGAEGTDGQEAVQLKHHDLIDDFISFAGDGDAMRQQLLASETESEEPNEPLGAVINVLDDDDLMTESLAKIYIKQKRYYKAVEIIRKLSLKYPEKSIYFADQIRFLEKLITNVKKE